MYYKNEIYEIYNLDESQTVNISTDLGKNTFIIENKTVKMIDANCRDFICVKNHAILYNNQSIICSPNRIAIKIENNEESEIDSYAR